MMYDGSFSVTASIREVRNRAVVSHDQIENELWGFIEAAKTDPCDADLLQKVKNQVEASFLLSLSGTGIAGSLARMETAYEWEFLEEQYRQRMAVTTEDRMRVAQKYLTRGNSVTGILERERGGAVEQALAVDRVVLLERQHDHREGVTDVRVLAQELLGPLAEEESAHDAQHGDELVALDQSVEVQSAEH